jgi:hypothetical protein
MEAKQKRVVSQRLTGRRPARGDPVPSRKYKKAMQLSAVAVPPILPPVDDLERIIEENQRLGSPYSTCRRFPRPARP